MTYSARLPSFLRNSLLPFHQDWIPGITQDEHIRIPRVPHLSPEYGPMLTLSRFGSVKLMKWYLNSAPPGDVSPKNEVVEYACEYGNLKLLKWLRDYFGDRFRPDLGIAAAVLNGRSDIAAWITENFPDLCRKMLVYTCFRTYKYTVENEDLECLYIIAKAGLVPRNGGKTYPSGVGASWLDSPELIKREEEYYRIASSIMKFGFTYIFPKDGSSFTYT